ncbi:McrC family protein [Sulfurospirillum multivorans]|uniref:McrBC superfamily protein n=2 Tax=Sulfurospirillum multivorans TaxID=66821 RepID=A0AA86APS5_SULMK|nr:McrC family protein [Sulfurospirillum multivorans]AHJ13391.1 McrBC superfamily protein [Sulfurospirillum multivorans DSM 12446]QEH06882.1 McrBC superfamily protein [Sulfurospirillum multivorans]
MILKEYESLQYKDKAKPHFIKEETFLAIEKFVLDNEETAQYLKITTKKGFGKVLQAQNYVGVIQTKDGTTIEILPKIQNISEEKSKDILIKMLKTLKKSPFKNCNMAHLKSAKMPLLEIFITMFLEELAALVRKGIKSDYITKEENLKFLKGKLKIGEQIKQNTIHKERFFVEFQEFLSDRAENRLIKTTLQYLYKKSKLNANQQRIREFLFVFDEISVCKDIKNDFLHVKPNRQMKDYEHVLLWCKTFLLENSFSPYKGNDIAFALLFDMNLLFESYVGDYLKKKGLHVKLQDAKHHLAYENESGRFRLKPDILIYDEEELLIADTKWKILSKEKTNEGISQPDMYQLYAYGTKYEACQEMYLIYPKDNDINTRRFVFNKEKEGSLVLNTLFFDVEKKCFVKNDKEYRLLELIEKV